MDWISFWLLAILLLAIIVALGSMILLAVDFYLSDDDE